MPINDTEAENDIVAVYDQPGDHNREIMIDSSINRENISNNNVHKSKDQILAHIEEPPSDDGLEEDKTDENQQIFHQDTEDNMDDNMDAIEEEEQDSDVK